MTTAIRCSIVLFLYLFAALGPSAASAAKPMKRQTPPASGVQTKSKAVQTSPGDVTTLRQAAENLARRHGVRIIIDDAVRADLPAPAIAAGPLPGGLLEATLRGLFAGSELVFHYGRDPGNGAERLKTVWVFSHAQGPLHVVAQPGAPSRPIVGNPAPEAPTPGLHRPSGVASSEIHPSPSRRPQDGDENEKLQALQVDLASGGGSDVEALRRMVQEDASEAVRMLALDAYLTHPSVSEDEVRAMLDRMSGDSQQMLAEYAKSLLEARAATPGRVEIDPDPIEERLE
jgi:hypothetical protein